MKVLMSTLRARTTSRALLAVTLSMAFALSPAFSQQAAAITRAEVLKRANSWVAKRVSYSQRGSFMGYRRDCSGMVSMAWNLGKSYSSRSIRARTTRISLSKLQPGDAVLTPGHVEIFGGWKNKAKRQYIAITQTSWGGRAQRRVRTLSRRATGLRLKGITDAPPRPLAATARLVGAYDAPAPAPQNIAVPSTPALTLVATTATSETSGTAVPESGTASSVIDIGAIQTATASVPESSATAPTLVP